MNRSKELSEATPGWATSSCAQDFKNILTYIGAFLPSIVIRCLDSSLHYLEGGRWMHQHGFKGVKRVKTRNEIFEFTATNISSSQNPLYLEFGVHEGATILNFSNLIKNPHAAFHGFDSFIGLPERWNASNKRGHFSTDGQIPLTTDLRISFFKGWFNETLKNYKIPPHDILFINIDCDLYSSASCVLDALKPNIKLGTYLYFDEFYDRNHEMKAFEEFLEISGFKFECLMTTKAFANALFRRIA